MIYFGVNQFLERWKENLIAAIQLAAILILCVVLVASCYEQAERYFPFQELLDGEGVQFASMGTLTFDEEGNAYIGEHLSDLKGVEGFYYSMNTGTLWINENDYVEAIGLQPPMSSFIPEMAAGAWFTEAPEDGFINLCITSNPFGIGVGNQVNLLQFNEQGGIIGAKKAKVCGVIRDGAYYYNGKEFTKPASLLNSYRVFDASTNEIDLSHPLIFMSMDDLRKADRNAGVEFSMFLDFDDNISQEDLQSNKELLLRYGNINTFQELKEGALQSLRPKMMMLVPLLACLVLFAVVSMVTTTAISTVRGMKSYAVLYLSGMRWSGIFVISVIQSVLVMCLGGVIYWFGTNLIRKGILFPFVSLELHKESTYLCLAMIAFFFLLQALVPLLCVRGKTAARVLREVKR